MILAGSIHRFLVCPRRPCSHRNRKGPPALQTDIRMTSWMAVYRGQRCQLGEEEVSVFEIEMDVGASELNLFHMLGLVNKRT